MRHFATLALALGLAAAPTAQVMVAPTPGALNEAVNDNTTPGQVFVLQQSQTYLLTDRMDPSVDVVIEADGGDCPEVIADCPLIQPLDQGGSVERVLQIATAGVSATLRGVAVTNTSTAGTSDERTFRLRADGASLTLDRVLGYGEPQMFVRVDDAAPDIIIVNSIFKDIGDSDGNEDEGRVIDDRGNDIGRLEFVNNTVYSVNSRVIRDDGGTVGTFMFENNTIHHVGQYVLETGDVTGDATIRNNLLVDTGLRGGEDDGDPDSDDTTPQIRIGSVDGTATVTNNSWILDASLLPTGAVTPRLYDDDAAAVAQNTLELRPAFAEAQPAFYDFADEPFDYAYPASEAAATAATDGGPLGSELWFGVIVADEEAPVTVSTLRAAPNPVAGTGTIAFELATPADIRLDVFDALGRRVATLADGPHAAGESAVPFDAAALPMGVYVVRLLTDGAVQAATLTVVR